MEADKTAKDQKLIDNAAGFQFLISGFYF